MKRKFLLLIPIVIVVYLVFNISKVEDIKTPNYLNNYFKNQPKISHFKSEFLKPKSDTISIFNYDELKKGILVFRKSIQKNTLNNVVNFENEDIQMPTGDVLKSSIFKDDFKFWFNTDEAVSKINIIQKEVFKNNKLLNDTVFYYSPSTNSNLGLSFNNSNINIYSKPKKNEEVLIYLKDNYLYIFYSKPINNSQEKVNLYSLIFGDKAILNK